ncbi:AEC family transporter [Pectobacterium parvum]|uniref:AEC family transporter n=1 Tax=Pectobacterium parvum TaxID=2778550 RepID=UPI001FDA3507|nr:hypothetical protein [Pectobacterium parvum]
MIASMLLALVPIALLITLGAGVRRYEFIAETFWPQAERLGYYILLPSLFLHGLATADLSGLPVLTMVGSLVLSTVAVASLIVIFRRWLPVTDPAFTSVFQGGVRFNNYVGVSVAAGLFGSQGIALAAVANAAIVPTVNILCVLVFCALLQSWFLFCEKHNTATHEQSPGGSVPHWYHPAGNRLGAAEWH